MNRIEFRVFSCATCVTCGTVIALTAFCLISTKMPLKKKTCQPQYKKHSLYSIQGAKFKTKRERKKQFNAIFQGSHPAVPTDSSSSAELSSPSIRFGFSLAERSSDLTTMTLNAYFPHILYYHCYDKHSCPHHD